MSDPTKAFLFGSYRLVPDHRALLLADDGREVPIRSRAFDLLLALVERRDRTVSKDELLELIWPGRIVEEGNLTVHVASLRKLLGGGIIATLPGRGYRFVAPVEEAAASPTSSAVPTGRAEDAAAPAWPPSTPRTNLPASTSHLIGRDAALAEAASLLDAHRLVTLIGAGGIGKTCLGLEVARRLSPHYADGIWLVELGPLSDGDLVPGAVASALGLDIAGRAASVDAVTRALRSLRLLLVLDNCEHLLEAAAGMAEALIRAGPGLRVLATSREPLRAEGECLHRLEPLQVAPPTLDVTADDLRGYAAAELFVERARAADADLTPTEDQARDIMAICRRLDGIPLAIELAAARVATLGTKNLVARLDDRFSFLTGGRRTALPRHQTLAATLEWSYQLLPEPQRTLLRRLAVFAGDFSLEAAGAVAPDLHPSEIVGHIADLVSKSLVAAALQGDIVHYRLLDTTRLYGLEKLRSGDELQQARRRHAEHFVAFFATAEAESETRPRVEWLATYGHHIDNVRAALDWAFSPDGDAAVGVALTIAAVPLWVHLSLMSECRGRVERALASLGSGAAQGAPARMRLCAALGWSLMYAVGRARETGAAWATTLEIAEKLGDITYRLRALWGLWINHLNDGDFREALELARQFAGIATSSSDAFDSVMADRILATSLHYLGEQKNARLLIERVLSRYAALPQQPHIARYQSDQRVIAHYFQARILWLQGRADQAMRVVESNIEEAPSLGHALALGSVLGQGACPIALFTGDLAAAERYGTMLLDHSDRHDFRLWHGWARCFIGLVLAKQGDVGAGLSIMRAGLDQAGENKHLPRYLVLLGEFAACLGQAGEVALALDAIDEVLARCERSGEGWYGAELLRMKGELILLDSADNTAARAEEHFLRALDWAHRQDARSWELRAAISLARLWRDQRRARAAIDLLAPVRARFVEGFGTADLVAAAALLEELRRGSGEERGT